MTAAAVQLADRARHEGFGRNPETLSHAGAVAAGPEPRLEGDGQYPRGNAA